VTIADVHSARETVQAVGHQDLPVIAQIDVAATVQGKEAADPSRRPLQEAPRRRPRVSRAEAVDEEAHVHAARRRRRERVRKAEPGLVAVEDERGQVDRVPCRSDRLEHGGIRCSSDTDKSS